MVCLMCTPGAEQCEWCKEEPIKKLEEWPKWFTPSKYAKQHQIEVMCGLHPLGFRLTEVEGATCGNCRNRYRVTLAKTYQNCRKVKHTGGPGTDVRLKWRGCEHWEEK